MPVRGFRVTHAALWHPLSMSSWVSSRNGLRANEPTPLRTAAAHLPSPVDLICSKALLTLSMEVTSMLMPVASPPAALISLTRGS